MRLAARCRRCQPEQGPVLNLESFSCPPVTVSHPEPVSATQGVESSGLTGPVIRTLWKFVLPAMSANRVDRISSDQMPATACRLAIGRYTRVVGKILCTTLGGSMWGRRQVDQPTGFVNPDCNHISAVTRPLLSIEHRGWMQRFRASGKRNGLTGPGQANRKRRRALDCLVEFRSSCGRG